MVFVIYIMSVYNINLLCHVEDYQNFVKCAKMQDHKSELNSASESQEHQLCSIRF